MQKSGVKGWGWWVRVSRTELEIRLKRRLIHQQIFLFCVSAKKFFPIVKKKRVSFFRRIGHIGRGHKVKRFKS